MSLPVFFIIGRPRTGTTLLRSLFDAHPNVQIPWECQFILNLYPQYGDLNYWTKEKISQFYNDLIQQWQFSAWNINHEKLKADLYELEGKNDYVTVCETVYLNFISFYNKEEIKVIGDKNHGYTIYTDRLKKLWPEAKFIYILRDYRDNYHSVTKVDFELPVVSLVVYKWKYFYKKALEASKKYPDSFYFIRYEDLATDPHLHFSKICAFLNIPYLPEVFEFYRMKEKASTIYPDDILEKHHKSLFNPINTSRLGLWKKAMNKRQVKIADYVAGEYADRAGYQREFTKYNLLTAIEAAPGVLYARFLYFMTVIIDKFPYRLREKILSKGPLMLAKVFGKTFGKRR
ncbi:MAG: sulfotransferase family protein [Omnitrophica WOR_2 bacterium]